MSEFNNNKSNNNDDVNDLTNKINNVNITTAQTAEVHLKTGIKFWDESFPIFTFCRNPDEMPSEQEKENYRRQCTIKREIIDALKNVCNDMTEATAIQLDAIPRILLGRNFIGQAQPGAGKTVAFTIGMLSIVDPAINKPQVICLTPTRELANQIVNDAVLKLSARMVAPGTNNRLIKVATAIPPDKDKPQDRIPKGAVCDAHIIVGTPGTVATWIKLRYVDTSSIKMFVLDEADYMLAHKDSDGPKPVVGGGVAAKDTSLGGQTLDIQKQLSKRNKNIQYLFFSATFPKEVLDFAEKLLSPNVADIFRIKENQELVIKEILQIRLNTSILAEGLDGKLKALTNIYDYLNLTQTIIFVRSKADCDAVSDHLSKQGYKCSNLHGKLIGSDRDRVMQEFRDGHSRVLVTTNVLSRGVDVPSVGLVVNFDLPIEYEDSSRKVDPLAYIHRIGRASRYGRKGAAISLISTREEESQLLSIEKHYGYDESNRMTTDWDPNDMDGLENKIVEHSNLKIVYNYEYLENHKVNDDNDNDNNEKANDNNDNNDKANNDNNNDNNNNDDEH